VRAATHSSIEAWKNGPCVPPTCDPGAVRSAPGSMVHPDIPNIWHVYHGGSKAAAPMVFAIALMTTTMGYGEQTIEDVTSALLSG
jgi:hypothetical protein